MAIEDKKDNLQVTPSTPAMRLKNLKASRLSFARLIKSRAKGEIQDSTFRSLVWSLGLYIGYLKVENEIQLEERIKTIEKTLKRQEAAK